MRDPQLYVLAGVFVFWWILSALNQFHSGAWTRQIRKYLPLEIIPVWTFFAPNPARADRRLVWREEYNGHWSTWHELSFGFPSLRRRWLLNPELILNKAISDLTGSLPPLLKQDRSALLSSPYMTLLSTVLLQPRLPGCSSLQFAIVRTSMSDSARHIEIAFLSEIHEVSEPILDVC